MIYPFSFTCPRDWELFENLVESVRALGHPNVAPFVAFHDKAEPPTEAMKAFANAHGVQLSERRDKFFPWEGKCSCIAKVDGYKRMLSYWKPADTDYLASVDCDAMFFTADIFDAVGAADFYGFPHSEGFYIEELGGEWSWMSGCLQVARAGKARKVVTMLKENSLEPVFAILDRINQAHNEDVAFSLAMALAGASYSSIDEHMEHNPEVAIRGVRSFAHLQGTWTKFLGSEVNGKWDLPKAIRAWRETHPQ